MFCADGPPSGILPKAQRSTFGEPMVVLLVLHAISFMRAHHGVTMSVGTHHRLELGSQSVEVCWVVSPAGGAGGLSPSRDYAESQTARGLERTRRVSPSRNCVIPLPHSPCGGCAGLYVL